MSSPFGKKAPESYFSGLRRKDSKNALTTCHGLTSNGRACRRALSSPKNSSKFDGAVVITGNDNDPAVFFCWQHKDQAESASANDGNVVELKGRHSLEAAFRSLGLEDVEETEEAEERARDMLLPEPTRTVAIDYEKRYEKVRQPSSPILQPTQPSPRPRRRYRNSRESESESPQPKPRQRETRTDQSSGDSKSTAWPSLFACCFGQQEVSRKVVRHTSSPQDEGPRIVRPKHVRSKSQQHERRQAQRISRRGSDDANPIYPQTDGSQSPRIRRKELPSHRRNDSGVEACRPKPPQALRRASEGGDLNHRREGPRSDRPSMTVYRDAVSERPAQKTYLQPSFANSESVHQSPQPRPLNQRSKSTPDSQQLNRIHGEWPPPLARNATDSTRIAYAKLLTAMSEPPTKGDQPGYIYVFWQTDTEQADDETSAVASIISAPGDRGLQRQETILQRRFFQTSANAMLSRAAERRTIFLKIGRAANVHQRLSQWQKQCEYTISLLRSYPYDVRDHEAAKKVVYVGKVERLIHLHLEMLGQRVKKQCRCGTEHKEWFEVEANTRAVRGVDEIVRKWVQWSEDRFGY